MNIIVNMGVHKLYLVAETLQIFGMQYVKKLDVLDKQHNFLPHQGNIIVERGNKVVDVQPNIHFAFVHHQLVFLLMDVGDH